MSARFGDIVVGYDGSDPAAAAAQWAAVEARGRGLSLRVVLALELGTALPAPLESGAPWAVAHLEAAAAEALEAVVADLVRTHPDLPVERVLALGPAAAALVEESERAALVVLGNRGHGSLVGALLGSVAFGVSAHARCPVVVVRAGAGRHPGPELPVVVGVDGSQAARAALDEAAEVADRAGATVHLVAAWHPPVTPHLGATAWSEAYPEAELAEAAQGSAEAVLAAARQRLRVRHPSLPAAFTAVREHPVTALGAHSAGAGLVVVGSRGHGGFRSLLMGSVSRGVVHVAQCPVLVVRPPGPGFGAEA